MRRLDSTAVYTDLEQFSEPRLMDRYGARPAQGGDVFSFEYDRHWLLRPTAFAFDPDLALVQGAQYPLATRGNFGIFLDSSPATGGAAYRCNGGRACARSTKDAERDPLPSGIFSSG